MPSMRVRQLWERISQSLWFIPSVLTAGAILLSYGTITLDRSFGDDNTVHELWFIFGVGAEGARATLSALAQSVITVTGVVFSVTIIALQLAATQFTPRVLRTFLSDRGNQWVLGIFIATFTYTILVERTVGSPPGGGDAFVPSVSVTVAVGLILLSIGALIFFINHIAQSMRASVIVSNVARDGRRLVDSIFPEMIGEEPEAAEQTPPLPIGEPIVLRCDRAGYVQSVDENSLFSVASEGQAVIRMEPQIGHFVLPGEPLVSVWFDEPPGADRNEKAEELEKKLRKGIILGGEWTLQQDLERALVELSDIAVRALSPSLNDPTTATLCVDRLGEVLTLLGRRRFPSTTRSDEAGTVRFIAPQLSWERAVEVSFEKIRLHGANMPSVILRLIQVCGRMGHLIPPWRREPLRKMLEAAWDDGRRELQSDVDLERIEHAYREALEGLGGGEGEPGEGRRLAG